MACTIYGGTIAETEKEAAALSKILEREIEVGARVEEDPCCGWEGIQVYEARGMRCPRPGPDLMAGNHLAWEVMQLSIGELTRQYVEPMLRDHQCTRRTRIEIRRRVAAALSHPDVTAILYPKPEKKEEEPK